MKMVLVRPEENPVSVGTQEEQASVQVKAPKRVLHFCDGVLEEYSTDEEDNKAAQQQEIVDASALTWGPWFSYKAWSAGSSTLYIIDRVGEFLSNIFGITTPRYYFELEEYKRREEIKNKQEEEEKGWSQNSAAVPLTEVTSKEPKPVAV